MPEFAYFVVLDRDFSGTQVSAHNSNGDDDPWEYGQLYSHVIGKGAIVQSGGWVGSTNAAGDNLVLAPAREDGYAVRGLMIQGVRSYDSNTEQWTTPDAYKGDVHDPMSQRSYMWNNNNPVAYSDPSGYCAAVCVLPVAIACPECAVAIGIGTLIGAGAAIVHSEFKKAQASTSSPEPQAGPGPSTGGGSHGDSRLPRTGPPGQTVTRPDGKQVRTYGPNGEAEKDIDYGHDHGAGDPHAHDWPSGQRGSGRTLTPEEQQQFGTPPQAGTQPQTSGGQATTTTSSNQKPD